MQTGQPMGPWTPRTIRVRHVRLAIALSIMTAVLGGCVQFPRKPPPVVRVSEVIDAVKKDLGAFAEAPVAIERLAPNNAQCSDGGKIAIRMVPNSVRVKLKTVVATENDPSVGFVAPLGVVTVDGYSGAYSRSDAQTLTISLSPMGLIAPKTAKPVLPSDLALDIANESPLYTTLVRMAYELLDVDHTKKPCVLPTAATAVIDFDVVDRGAAGVSIRVLGFKFGDKISRTNEHHQSLEFGFDLAGSSPLGPIQ